MSKILELEKNVLILSFAAAATTVIAGILHLQMVPQSLSHDLGEGTLFLVGGILQVFWAVPVIKRWGKIWQIIGIAGTIVFFVLWYASRLHMIPMGGMPPREFQTGNMTGTIPRGPPPGGIGIDVGGLLVPPIEIFQLLFIGLYAAQSKIISKK